MDMLFLQINEQRDVDVAMVGDRPANGPDTVGAHAAGEVMAAIPA